MMFDRLLSFGTTFDWFSPLMALIQDATNGPRHDFYVDRNAGWSAGEIERLLKRHGVKSWGLIIMEDMFVFSVRKAQTWWAQHLLLKEGIPVLGGLVEKSGNNQPQARSRRPVPSKKRTHTNLMDEIVGWLDDLEKQLGL